MTSDSSDLLNWSKTHKICSPSELLIINSEEELLRLFAQSPTSLVKYRVLGSRYSHTDLLRPRDAPGAEAKLTVSPGAQSPDETDTQTSSPLETARSSDNEPSRAKVILLEGLQGLIEGSALAETPDGGRLVDPSDPGIWAWAGTKLKDLFVLLEKHGRIIQCSPGVISEQTIAGAIATGTHGQGLRQCCLSDAVLAVRLVSASGYIYDIYKGHPWFGAAILSLGCLGVITRVKFTTRPLTQYVCQKVTCDVDCFKRNFVQWNREHEMVKAWWFPDENTVHVWLSDPLSYAHEAVKQAPTPAGESADIDAAVDKAIDSLKRDTKNEAVAEAKVFQTVTRFKDAQTQVSSLYAIWCKGIPVPQINVEIAVSLSQFSAAVDAVQQLMREQQERTHYPLIFRCTGPTEAWLGPSADPQGSCHIGFVVYFADDGYVSRDGAQFVYNAEKVLSDLGGRPHWGKFYTPTFYQWHTLYPRLNSFATLQSLLDPSHRLSQDCSELVLSERARMSYAPVSQPPQLS